jgi:Subtilase family
MRFGGLSHAGMAALAIALAGGIAPAWAQSTTGSDARPVTPYRGALDPFRGALDPFRGTLDPFRGNIDPFRGNLDPFRGNLDPFRGNLDPFRGPPLTTATVSSFWTTFNTDWSAIDNRWTVLSSAAGDAARYSEISGLIDLLSTNSEKFWGGRVAQRTGKGFREGFTNRLLAKYGLSANDPASFGRLSASDRSRLVFDWYDSLNEFAGIDRVDHWMGTINWNPNLTKIQGSGADSVIGLLDSTIINDADLQSNVVSNGGFMSSGSSHGNAVASLLVADHDGKGVQGIAPNARLATYNPFDDSNTASFNDVRTGIVALKNQKASIINVSLGVKGWTLNPEWNNVFSHASVSTARNSTVYVIAAGNDGISQTQNIAWNAATSPALIVVGSVDPQGVISQFSNRPGTACLTQNGVCAAGSKLADRFVVAPGELLLVSDGNGGLGRVSGTSFAAPLVSGTIALLHDRWPWLANYPKESVDIILSTAKDLGAPGTDAVYGRGLIDVEASQSPINFDNLTYYEYKASNGKSKSRTAKDIITKGHAKNWEADGIFYYLIENIGATRRDFAVPIANRLIGQRTSVSGTEEYFQGYVTSRLNDWIKSGSGFTDVITTPLQSSAGWNFGFNFTPPKQVQINGETALRPSVPSVRLADPTGRFGFSTGSGDGSRALFNRGGFGFSSDYDASEGGINPFLGLASGGAFMAADVALSDKATASIGFTQATRSIEDRAGISTAQRDQLGDVEDYRANAVNVSLAYDLNDMVTLNLDYTKLNERNGLLGTQSLEPSDLRDGTSTDTATFGASFNLPSNITLGFSASAAMTKSGRGANQALTTRGRGVLSSAFAVSASKFGVFGKRDALRFSVAQPLTVERGTVSFTSTQITDRSTGELGEVTQTFNIGSKTRRFLGELLYATPIMEGGELSLFGRAETSVRQGESLTVDEMVIGGRVSLGF